MGQWLSNLAPWEIYLIAAPSVMLGAILLVGGILLLLAPRNKNDAETLEAIRKELEKAGAEFKTASDRGEERRPKPTLGAAAPSCETIELSGRGGCRGHTVD